MNKKQLALLRCGVDDWNEWREKTEVRFPDLEGADLRGNDLIGANLSSTNLNGALLSDTTLKHTSFFDAELKGADLAGADLTGADLTHATLSDANISQSYLTDTRLYKAELNNEDLSYSYLRGAKLYGANLEGANLYEAEEYVLSRNYVRGTRLNTPSKDPWSILKKKYTGSTMIWTILALLAAFTPYLAKALYWTAFNRYQISSGNTLDCYSSDCFSVLELILGLDRELHYLIVPLTLILYNLLRGLVTLMVAKMKDEEDISSYTPTWIYIDEKKSDYTEEHSVLWRGYRQIYSLHKVIYLLGVTATIAFIYNAYYWLSQIVWLPK